ETGRDRGGHLLRDPGRDLADFLGDGERLTRAAPGAKKSCHVRRGGPYQRQTSPTLRHGNRPMKTLLASFALSLLALAGFSTSARADEVVTLNPDGYAAVAYSAKTGKYGYAYNLGSRGAAEREALSGCKEDDAKIVGWVNDGFLVLVIADDNAY